MPLVSVIVPCFNHARFLSESVDSILGQSYRDLELIIVDDCSSDGSWDLISTYARGEDRIKAIRHKRNEGASKSRNDGLEAATGAYIAFCDADDIWERDKLRIQVRLLEENPDCDIVYSDALIIDEQGAPTNQRFSDLFPVPRNPSGRLFSDLVRTNFINMQSVLMTRKCVQCGKDFDEQIKWVEDWWFWVRMAHEFRFLYYGEPLARYRVHSLNSAVVQSRGVRVNRFKVLRRILKEYPDLPLREQGEVTYAIGAELCLLGKNRLGREVLLRSLKMAVNDWRGGILFCRVMRRLATALLTVAPHGVRL